MALPLVERLVLRRRAPVRAVARPALARISAPPICPLRSLVLLVLSSIRLFFALSAPHSVLPTLLAPRTEPSAQGVLERARCYSAASFR